MQVRALKIVRDTHGVMSDGSEGDRYSLPSDRTTSIHHNTAFVIDIPGQSGLIKEPWVSSDDLDLSNSGSAISPFNALAVRRVLICTSSTVKEIRGHGDGTSAKPPCKLK